MEDDLPSRSTDALVSVSAGVVEQALCQNCLVVNLAINGRSEANISDTWGSPQVPRLMSVRQPVDMERYIIGTRYFDAL